MVDVTNLKEGDVAGISIFQRKFGQIGVRMSGGKKFVFMASNETDIPIEMGCEPLTQNCVYLKVTCNFRDRADVAGFSYSLDGKEWVKLGGSLKMEYTLPEHFMGYRFGLFNYATRTPGGYADFDWFSISPEM